MRARTASRNGSVTVPVAMAVSVGGPSARRPIGRSRVGCPQMTERPRGPRRLPITLAAVIVASLFTLAPAAARPALAADPEAAPQSLASPETTVVGASAITPGSVNRTSVNLTRLVRRHARAALRVAGLLGRLDRDHHEHLGRPDRPGRAQHDRRPPRRDDAALRPGGRGQRRSPGQGPDHHRAAWAASWPPGRPSRSASSTTPRCGRPSAARTGCSRRSTASSMPIAGSRGSAARPRSAGRTTVTRSSRPSARSFSSGS